MFRPGRGEVRRLVRSEMSTVVTVWIVPVPRGYDHVVSIAFARQKSADPACDLISTFYTERPSLGEIVLYIDYQKSTCHGSKYPLGVRATVSELVCYPVKGCAGHSLQSARMTFRGLEHDRDFMIVDEDLSFRSQRSDPVLAAIRPAIEGGELTLAHSDFGSVTCAIDRESTASEVTMFGRPFRGIDQGDEIAMWLSEVIGDKSRLVAAPPDFHRVTDGIAPGTAAFADSAAVHILSESTLTGLNARLDRKLPMDRFRPNIVVSGWESAHTEDLVRAITIGATELTYTKLAIRCAVTTVDQHRGERDGREPLKTLATYRKARQKGVAFGSKFAVVEEGILTVGDEVFVASWGDTEL